MGVIQNEENCIQNGGGFSFATNRKVKIIFLYVISFSSVVFH